MMSYAVREARLRSRCDHKLIFHINVYDVARLYTYIELYYAKLR